VFFFFFKKNIIFIEFTKLANYLFSIKIFK